MNHTIYSGKKRRSYHEHQVFAEESKTIDENGGDSGYQTPLLSPAFGNGTFHATERFPPKSRPCSLSSVSESIAEAPAEMLSTCIHEDEPEGPVSTMQPDRNEVSRLSSQSITHPESRIVRVNGSDVMLMIPKGAVPEGKCYNILIGIIKDLRRFNRWMKSPSEYIIGPVPEFYVECGGTFDKHVVVWIPHCLSLRLPARIRVLCSDGDNYVEVPRDDHAASVYYTLNTSYIHIHTKHFTRFIVSADSGAIEEVTDALVTVAALQQELRDKSRVQLRVMLHSKCATQNDFSAERRMFYDEGMEEISRLKIELPERGALPYPQIVVEFVIEDKSRWAPRSIRGRQLRSLKQERDGVDVLRPRAAGQSHRSEQIAEFSVESVLAGNRDPLLIGYMKVDFIYSEEIIKTHIIEVVYPQLRPRRKLSGQATAISADPVNDVLIEIAKRIDDEYVMIAAHLPLSQSDWERIRMNHPKTFDRNLAMLNHWRHIMMGDDDALAMQTLVEVLKECKRADLADLAVGTLMYICSQASNASPASVSSGVVRSRKNTPTSDENPYLSMTTVVTLAELDLNGAPGAGGRTPPEGYDEPDKRPI